MKIHCGVEQLGARRAHNPKVTGSSPVPATKKKSAVTKVTALFLFPSHSNPNSHFITSTFLLCECEVPKYQDKCESEGSFSLRSSLLFLAKHPITSIRNEMEDIRVPATKKKSAVCKD